MTACLLAYKTTGDASRLLQISRCYRTAAWQNSVSRLWNSCRRSLLILRRPPGCAIVRPASQCKSARKLFTPNTTSCAAEPLHLIQMDICGPLEPAIGGDRYMLLFIDDATWHMDEYILKYKSEALEKFNQWKALREEQSGNQVKWFRTGGGEYTSKKFAEYLKSEGILQKRTTTYPPQPNGVVRQANPVLATASVHTAAVRVWNTESVQFSSRPIQNQIRIVLASCNPDQTENRGFFAGLEPDRSPNFTVSTPLAPIQYLSFNRIVTWSICRLCSFSRSFTSHSQICDQTDIHWVAVR